MKAKMKQKTWADYDIGDPSEASYEELKTVVRKAAKTANQRLLRLERAGFTKGVYKSAMADLGNMREKDGKPTGGRRRFAESPQKLTLNQLRHEYRALRSFLSAKSSTIQGRNEIDDKRYQAAVANGYNGTFEDFYADVDKYFTAENEKLYSSRIIYESITAGDTDLMDEIIEESKTVKKSKAAMIIEYKKKASARAKPK